MVLLCCAEPKNLTAQQVIFSPQIVQTIENSRASDAFWSVIVRDSSGKILDGYNFDKLVRPASNLKLLTSAAILDELGPDFKYSTRMYGLGYQSADTWQGDIIIRGTGDPSISGRFYNKDRFHVFDKFYTEFDSLGIKHINGNLIGNDSYFDQKPYPEGWSWQDLSFYYGVEISALSFNNNAVDLTVYANGKVGESPRIEWFPFDTDYVSFINEQIITPLSSQYDEYYQRLLGTNTIILGSTLPKNYVERESLSISNASLFFLDTFKKYLRHGKISMTGNIIVDSESHEWDKGPYTLIFEHQSVQLRKLLQEMNRESSNFYAEMLLKTMAAVHFNTVGSTELGLSLVTDFAASMNLDTTKLEMHDASGMAPSTLMTTEDLSSLLINMQSHPAFDSYRQSLSLAGRTGSLKNRFRNTPLQDSIYGKTGYVSGVRALSGYMKTSSGQSVVFSIIVNNYTEQTSYIDYIQEKIITNLYKKY